MTEKCPHCGASCTKEDNEDNDFFGHGWHCNCVFPCQHADAGTGWYITKRKERITEEVTAIYYVWADNPEDAINKLNQGTTPRAGLRMDVRMERDIDDIHSRTTEPLGEFGPVSYDFNEGMGR